MFAVSLFTVLVIALVKCDKNDAAKVMHAKNLFLNATNKSQAEA